MLANRFLQGSTYIFNMKNVIIKIIMRKHPLILRDQSNALFIRILPFNGEDCVTCPEHKPERWYIEAMRHPDYVAPRRYDPNGYKASPSGSAWLQDVAIQVEKVG